MTYEEKKSLLKDRIDALAAGNTVLAFSGGVDSALLLSLLKESSDRSGTEVLPVTFHTYLHPAVDMDVAERFCREMNTSHRILSVDEMENPAIAENPKDRCYLCKKMLFGKLRDLAAAAGIPAVIDGTNLDDTKVYRPGLRALSELGIISPLKDAGFTKEDVRRLAGERGLSVSRRPSSPCLATRFPYDTHLTREMLALAERGEAVLGRYLSGNLRLRIHGNLARIEADPDQFPKLLEARDEITKALKDLGLQYITLDLSGFHSGSYDLTDSRLARESC